MLQSIIDLNLVRIPIMEVHVLDTQYNGYPNKRQAHLPELT